jgi:hypothetical protein
VGLRAVAVLAVVAGCYDPPMPVCGFSCLEVGECPDGYTCDRRGDGFCHLSSNPNQDCPGHEGVTFDDQPPELTSISPEPGTQIAAGGSIILFFDEPVTHVTNDSFFITVDSTGEKLFTNVSPFQGAQAWELQLGANLPLDQSFTVTITSAVTDLAGNPLAGETLSYFSQSPTPPMLVGSVPSASQTGVSVGVQLQLFFDKAAPNILSVFHVEDQFSNPVIYNVDPTTSTQDPIFNLRWQLAPNTAYRMRIDPGLMDITGHATSTGTAILFATGVDNVGPRIWGRTPGFSAVNVPVSSGVLIEFDEDAQNVDASSIELQKNGVAVPGQVTYDAATRSAHLRPDTQLDGLTNYDVIVTTAVTDAFGNSTLDGGSSFQTDLDHIAPQIRATTPQTGSSNVPVTTTIAMTFDEPTFGLDASTVFVTAGAVTITGTLVATNGGHTWTFTPDAPLPAMTTIDVDIGLASDSIGNSTSYFYSFTTAP